MNKMYNLSITSGKKETENGSGLLNKSLNVNTFLSNLY